MAASVQSWQDLNETNLQEILQSSLSNHNLKVVSVKDPGSDLGSQNDQYGSVLKKIVVLVSEDGVEKEVHMIMKSALEKGMIAKKSKLGIFIFHIERLSGSRKLFQCCLRIYPLTKQKASKTFCPSATMRIVTMRIQILMTACSGTLHSASAAFSLAGREKEDSF